MAANDTRERTDDLLPEWIDPDGVPVSCIEKIKVLNENIVEIREMCREALEDAVLMGCDERQIRAVLLEMVRTLQEPFKD
ncbi:MAG: hypothetical protein QF926_00945 [Alphaproteobacteria bacterium]|jgi:hypothetical protein|nr:hypothetical protein [Alphaproteobacteria bacterium]MDP6515176.1 hypothetical protein [Alphaproteobacteria bacterium]